MVFHVDSFRLFSVLRATTARISGKRMQLLTNHTLETNDLPPPAGKPGVQCVRCLARFGDFALDRVLAHDDTAGGILLRIAAVNQNT